MAADGMTHWLAWDGRRLAWDHAAAAADAGGALELCIDDVTFKRLPGDAPARGECDFEFSPSGCVELEFSLRSSASRRVAAPWRVRHGSPATPGEDQWTGPVHAMRSLSVAPPAVPLGARRTSIVVPIYNSPQLVKRCIDAVLRWTRAPARLILIDDASPDPAVATLLADYSGDAHVVARVNAHNLGYTRSSNLGIELAGDDDVVLLNSDTEVGPRWLDALREVAAADARVGTVTAVSDNAGAFSVPELEHYCPIPEQWSLPQAQRALLQHAYACLPELPTGNGFCMFIARAMLDRVGVLDAQAFPSGYGEENDLCQRAERAGFRHVIAGNVLVRHARSASFGDARRAALGAQGMAVLRQRYPDYEAKVGATLWSFQRHVLDYRVRRVYADRDHFYAALPPRPRVLLAGGAIAFAAALRAQFDCRRLDAREISVDALRSMLCARAIEFVHLHMGLPAEDALRAKLAQAANESGVAFIDSSNDEVLAAAHTQLAHAAPAPAAPLPAAHVAERCHALYRAAFSAASAFGASCDAQFA